MASDLGEQIVSASGGTLSLVIPVRNSQVAVPVFTAGANGERQTTTDGITYSIEGSVDLFNWDEAVVSVGDQGPGSLPTGWTYWKFTLTPPSWTKGFLRVRIGNAAQFRVRSSAPAPGGNGMCGR